MRKLVSAQRSHLMINPNFYEFFFYIYKLLFLKAKEKSKTHMTCKPVCLINAYKGEGVPILSCCKSFSVQVGFSFSFVLTFKKQQKQQNPYELHGASFFLFLLFARKAPLENKLFFCACVSVRRQAYLWPL